MNEIGVIPRASRILRMLAGSGAVGARLTDITDATGLSRPTAHRILKDLAGEGLVSQDEQSSRYFLGEELTLLALSAPQLTWDLPSLTSVAQSLAEDVGDTVYVSTRTLEGVRYLVRAEGDYPVRALMVDVGEIKPFTSSYSGLALLASSPEDVVIRALAAHLNDAPEGWWEEQHSESRMREQIVDVMTKGYCGGPGLVLPGVSGMAAPVESQTGIPLLAVSISAIDSRLDEDRIALLAPRLLAATRQISQLVSHQKQPPTLEQRAKERP